MLAFSFLCGDVKFFCVRQPSVSRTGSALRVPVLAHGDEKV